MGVANDWVAIARGADQSLALKSDGSLWAWGNNQYGQLGVGWTFTERDTPQLGWAVPGTGRSSPAAMAHAWR